MTYPIEILPQAVLDTTLIATNKVPEGAMEYEGVTSWIVGNSAVLTKEGNAYQGHRCLRVDHGGTTNPYAQTPPTLTPGKKYHTTGRARSDGGLGYPQVQTGTDNWWTGTTSTAWQEIDVIFTASAANLDLYNIVGAAGGYSEFDAIVVREINAAETEYVDSYYYLSIWGQGDGVAKPVIYDGGTALWTGTASTVWQLAELVFLPLTTKIALGADMPAAAVGFDNASLNIGTDFDAARVSSPSTTPFGSHVIQYDIDSVGNVDVFVDGAATTLSPSSLTVRKLDGGGQIGAELGTESIIYPKNYNHGNIGEVLVYERILDADERENLTAFLKAKWGIA